MEALDRFAELGTSADGPPLEAARTVYREDENRKGRTVMTLADTHDVDAFVYDFDEYCEQGRALLGGKGLGLAEMTQIGLPIRLGDSRSPRWRAAPRSRHASLRRAWTPR